MIYMWIKKVLGDFFCFSTFKVHCMLRSLVIKNLKKFDNIGLMKKESQWKLLYLQL